MTTQPGPPRRLFVSMVVALDGYIEDPARALDSVEDGGPQFEQYCDEMLDSVGVALHGRRTYGLMVEIRSRVLSRLDQRLN